MSELLLELSNSQHWEQAYEREFVAQRTGSGGYYYPIPEFEIPILFTSNILAVATDQPEARTGWWYACSLRMYLDGPGIVGGEVFGIRRKIPLNRSTLIRLPKILPQYKLKVSIPPWHRKLSLTIWEYQGPVNDSTEDLIRETGETIRIDLARIEFKIDQQ